MDRLFIFCWVSTLRIRKNRNSDNGICDVEPDTESWMLSFLTSFVISVTTWTPISPLGWVALKYGTYHL